MKHSGSPGIKAVDVWALLTSALATPGSIGISARARYWLYAAAEGLQFSNAAEKTTTSVTFVKLKEIKMTQYYDDLRIKFSLKRVGGANFTSAQLKLNGVTVGAQQTGDDTWDIKTIDIGEKVYTGDTIEIWGKKNNANVCHVKDMEIHWTLTETQYENTPISQDP